MSRVALCGVVLAAACGRVNFGLLDDPNGPHELVLGPFSTNSMTFVDIPGATLTIPPSVDTKWLLLTSATLYSATVEAVSVEARYLVDGLERCPRTPMFATARWTHAYS